MTPLQRYSLFEHVTQLMGADIVLNNHGIKMNRLQSRHSLTWSTDWVLVSHTRSPD